MKLFFSIIAFLSILAAESLAQNPEFYLMLRLRVNDNLWPKALYIGYDLAASDSLEGDSSWLASKGGEVEYPPPGFDDFRLGGQSIDRPYLGSGALIDIRRKPDSASFQLSYEIQMTVSNDYQYASIFWNNQAILPIIRNMILEPATISPGPWRKQTEMKEVSEIIFPNRDSINLYRFMNITLYYNRAALVEEGMDAIRTLSLVSNPAMSWLSAILYTEESLPAKVVLLDIAGRVVNELSLRSEAGINPIGFDCSRLPGGAYKLVAYLGGNAYSQTVIVAR